MNNGKTNAVARVMMTKSIDCERLSVTQYLIETTKRIFHCDQRRRIWFLDGMSGSAGAILISTFLLTSAFAQEQQKHAYSEYAFWYGGAFWKWQRVRQHPGRTELSVRESV